MGWGAPSPEAGAARGAGPLAPELDGAAARCGGECVVGVAADVVRGAEYVTSDVVLGVRVLGAGARRFATCGRVRRSTACRICVRGVGGRRGCMDLPIARPVEVA